jgi:hypothetical protein
MANMHLEKESESKLGLKAASKWAAQVGITSTTLWRFRKRGWIKTINIAGRQYISEEEIARFTSRAKTGEFTKHHITPSVQAKCPQ